MSQTGNRKLRTRLLSVLCLSVWLGAAGVPALAQRRVPSNAPPETPSQRWLPLPQGGSADLKQQVQWLQQLKGLIGVEGAGGETPKLPKLDPEQLKALLDAMRQLSGSSPDGTSSPALDGISPEQVSKALADPELREQARRLLEQFSREGKLPQRGANADSKGMPFPSTSPERGRGADGALPERDRSASATAEESPAKPRAMPELLQRLAQQAGRQPNGVSPERDPATGGASEQDPGAADSRNDLNRQPRSPAADQRPAANQPFGPSQQELAELMLRSLVRSGNAESKSPQTLPREEAEMRKNGPTLRDQPFQAGSSDLRSDRFNPRTPQSRDTHPTGPASGAGPSPSDPSTGGPTTDSRPVGSESRVDSENKVPARTDSPAANRTRASRGTAMPPASSRNRGPTSPDPPSGAKPLPMDVRSELEQQGFAQTLRKIVEQTREESLVASNGASPPPVGGTGGGSGSMAGLEGSVVRMLDGLRKSLVEPGSESSVAAPASVPMPPGSAPSSAPQPNPDRRSALNRVGQAAGSVLSDIATPPASRSTPVRSPRATASGGTADAPGAGSRSAVGLLLLLVVLGLVWYFVPQFLSMINASHRAGSLVGGAIHPADIRSRADVVRAFHQYALRPATPAPTWWTHREVERQVAQATPALRPAIRSLTDLYEQARYLPDDADFTPDQLGTARRALEQCEACPSGA